MKTIYKLIACMLFLSFSTYHISYAQLVVTSGLSADELVTNLLGEGLEVISTSINCPGTSAGSFEGGASTNIGVDAGVLLTSGSVNSAPGPNNSNFTTVNNNAPGDAALTALAGVNTFDACILEFTFIPEGTFISFQYTFASEEYEEYYCSNYNDVFAFLVSGPSPIAGDYVDLNIAQIPGTTLPVTINNVGPGTCDGVDNSALYNNNAGGVTIEYDGFTNVFTASVDLVPCEEYIIRLAIADSGDRVLDSGIFLQQESFISSNVEAEAIVQNPTCPGNSDGSIDVTVTNGVGPFSYLWEDGTTMEDRTGLIEGSYSLQITDGIGCSVEMLDFTLVDDVDTIPPMLSCTDVIVVLDASGNASIVVEDVASATDYCGVEMIVLDQYDFSCLIGDYSIEVTATDVNGNMSTCLVVISVTGADEDCDTVTDACDECSGGDDTVDNNGDGLPDCSNPPALSDIIDAWKCGKKKVFMCHIPPGNPANAHTICINYNAISAHLGHGDYLGPCGNASCTSFDSDHIDTRSNRDLNITIYPNPVKSDLFVQLENTKNGQITIRNHLGQLIFTQDIGEDVNKINIDLQKHAMYSGIYYLMYQAEGASLIKKFVVK